MQLSALERDRVALGSERAAKRLVGIEDGAVLLEPDDTQTVGTLDLAGVRSARAGQDVEQRRLPASVRSDHAESRAGRDREREVREEPVTAQRDGQPARDEQLPAPALRRGEIDVDRAG